MSPAYLSANDLMVRLWVYIVYVGWASLPWEAYCNSF